MECGLYDDLIMILPSSYSIYLSMTMGSSFHFHFHYYYMTSPRTPIQTLHKNIASIIQASKSWGLRKAGQDFGGLWVRPLKWSLRCGKPVWSLAGDRTLPTRTMSAQPFRGGILRKLRLGTHTLIVTTRDTSSYIRASIY